MKRTAVIVNPHAGAGKAARIWPEVENRLRSRLGAVAVRFTEAPGQGVELARELVCAGLDRIVAAGGDGTANEVANGLFESGELLRPEARFGILPLGTGGDLRRTLGIPNRIGEAVDLLASEEARAIDVGVAKFRGHCGHAESRLFLNIASFGLGGEVAAGVRYAKAPLGKTAAYAWATLVTFLRHRPWSVRLAMDSLREPIMLPVAHVAAGNGRFQAAGMEVCPEASPFDGILEVTVIEQAGLPDLLYGGWLLYSSGLYRHPKVRHYRATRITADSEISVPLELDGEPLGTLPAEFTLLPQRLPVIGVRSSPIP